MKTISWFHRSRPQDEHRAELNKKVKVELLIYAYKQIILSQFAAIFCSTILVLALHGGPHDDFLYGWYGITVALSIIRLGISLVFQMYGDPLTHLDTWTRIFFIGAILGGICWGAESFLLTMSDDMYEKMLCIFILAGITAGAIASLSAMYTAAAAFLILAITPFVVEVYLADQGAVLLNDAILTVYMCYMVLLSRRTHFMIENNIRLQFKNEILLKELAKANLELKHMATHDPVTHVDNKWLFNSNFEAALKNASRKKSSLALLYIDLDKFKTINDTFGHQIGDELLQIVVVKLKSMLRSTDMMARMGGDEFAIVLEKIKTKADVASLAQDLCAELEQPIFIQHHKLMISLSIGISIYPQDGETRDNLLNKADEAMYFVKRQGGNNYQFYN